MTLSIGLAHAKTRKATLHAVVTRADGRVEDLGMIAYYHRNPIWRWIVNAFITVRRRFA
jgi:hypothetical protein